MKYILLHLLFFSSLNFTYSQEPHYINYSIKDGLPSSEVHDIYKDSRGFMWFATDRGIVRYDSKTFRTFNENDGLPNSVVFNFFEESKLQPI